MPISKNPFSPDHMYMHDSFRVAELRTLLRLKGPLTLEEICEERGWRRQVAERAIEMSRSEKGKDDRYQLAPDLAM